MLDPKTYDLLIRYIYREYDLPVEEYCRLIALPLNADQQQILNIWLEKLYSGILQTHQSYSDYELSLAEKLVLQRWSIDLGSYEVSLKLFSEISQAFSDLPEQIQNWVLFLAGKAKQHSGNTKEALYFYDQLKCRKLDQILMLYISIERAYILYQNGDFQNSLREIDEFGRAIQQNENHGVQAKVMTNYGILLYCYGRLAEAKKSLSHVVEGSSAVINYRQRALLYLFQLNVETLGLNEAEKYLRETKLVYYDHPNEYRLAFCRYWIMWLQMKGSQQEVLTLVREVEKTLLNQASWAHKVSFVADCCELTKKELIQYSRECRAKNDVYSRYYLWLKQIYRGNVSISVKRQIKILHFFVSYFEDQMLLLDLFLTEALILKLKKENPSLAWIEKTHSLGHSYLFHVLWEKEKKSQFKKIFVVGQNSSLIFCSDGEKIDLGKDRNSPLILSLLARGIVEPEVIITETFGDKDVDFHSYKKLNTAVYRINRKLGDEIIKVQKTGVDINADFAFFLME